MAGGKMQQDEGEWIKLLYTYDCQGDFMKLGRDIFPYNVKNKLFDIKLRDNKILEKCLIVTTDRGITATAILQDGSTLQLEHEVYLRSNPDEKIEKNLSSIHRKIMMKKWRAGRLKDLKTQKEQLLKSLSQVNKDIEKIEKMI